LEHFQAPGGLGPDLAAEPPAGNTLQKLQKQLIWSIFSSKTDDLEHFCASGGLGPDL